MDLAGSFIRGMHQAGMAATGKHFPGHGHVIADSHLETPYDDRSQETIFSHDIQPFQQLIEQNLLQAIMPAHVIYSQCDNQPASGSKYWLQDILRAQLNFNGAIFSDDLGMKGAGFMGDFVARSEQALNAGCDLLLLCNERDGVIQVLDNLKLSEKQSCFLLRQQRLQSLFKRKNLTWTELERAPRWLENRQKLTALQTQLQQKNTAEPVNLPSFEAEKSQLAKLAEFSQVASDQISALNQELAAKEQQLSALQQQVQRLTNQSKAEQPNDWLLTEADFLLNNALRKLVLDNDVDTSVSLLKVASETLSKVAMPQVATVRSAINADLKKLLSLNNVDQNAIMQELSQLANDVDELNVLNVNFDEDPNTDKLTDSLEDWKSNAEKSAVSFLNHFIRITPKKADNKALLAPNQDIYLRENIRLRLQIAILAVPRQQDDLYKQSLETVASWVRTYFDTSTEVAQNFLKKLDELAEQSIYVDVPTQLSSLNALDKLLNKQPQEVQKITLSADKDFDPENVKATENHATSPAEQGNGADTSTAPNQPEQQEK